MNALSAYSTPGDVETLQKEQKIVQVNKYISKLKYNFKTNLIHHPIKRWQEEKRLIKQVF